MQLSIYTSTIADGSMKSLTGNYAEVLAVREQFLNKNEIKAEDTTLVQVVYEGDGYCRYVTLADADRGDGIVRSPSFVSDAIVAKTPGHALLLPIADCAPLVLFDPTTGAVMLSHLGRHSTEQDGGMRSVEYFSAETGARPELVQAWLGPAAGADNYPLWAFENKGFHEVITSQLYAAGVIQENLTVQTIDVTTHPDYFSHSNFLKGQQSDAGDGRFAVVAVVRP